LFVLDNVDLPKPESYVPDEQRPFVSGEIGAIRASCKEFEEELTKRPIQDVCSFYLAAIKLIGLHARIFILFTFCRIQKDGTSYIVAVPSTLEQMTEQTILRARNTTLEDYRKLQKHPNKDISEHIQKGEMPLSELLVILGKKYTLLVLARKTAAQHQDNRRAFVTTNGCFPSKATKDPLAFVEERRPLFSAKRQRSTKP
jgi:hypothetical protein